MVVLPVEFDSSHQQGCKVTVVGDGMMMEGAGRDDYALGAHPLSNGVYTWKVRVCD